MKIECTIQELNELLKKEEQLEISSNCSIDNFIAHLSEKVYNSILAMNDNHSKVELEN